MLKNSPSSPASVLVTGANGFVGKAVCQALSTRGLTVTAAVRVAPGSAVPAGATRMVGVGNIDGDTDWTAALAGCACVINLAARAHVLRDTHADPMAAFRATNVDGALQLARSAARAGVRRMVFVSSVGVNGNGNTRPFVETDIARPAEPYAVSKWEAEQALRAEVAGSGMELVIVRPPLVYGPDCPGNFLRLLKLVASGLPLPFAAIAHKRSYVGVWNLADFLVTCAVHPDAGGQLFLVSDMDDVALPALLRALAAGLGKPVRLWSFDPVWMGRLAALAGKTDMVEKLCGGLTVDAARAHAVLGWTPPLPLAEGLQRTGQWYARRSTLEKQT